MYTSLESVSYKSRLCSAPLRSKKLLPQLSWLISWRSLWIGKHSTGVEKALAWIRLRLSIDHEQVRRMGEKLLSIHKQPQLVYHTRADAKPQHESRSNKVTMMQIKLSTTRAVVMSTATSSRITLIFSKHTPAFYLVLTLDVKSLSMKRVSVWSTENFIAFKYFSVT